MIRHEEAVSRLEDVIHKSPGLGGINARNPRDYVALGLNNSDLFGISKSITTLIEVVIWYWYLYTHLKGFRTNGMWLSAIGAGLYYVGVMLLILLCCGNLVHFIP